MRINILSLTFDGTADEFPTVQDFLMQQAAAQRTADFDSAEEEADEPEIIGDTSGAGPSEAAFQALFDRVPLRQEYRSYIRSIYDAGVEGTTIPEIAAETNSTEARVKSAFRNFGKRTAHTAEWPAGERFFRQQWLGTQNRYWLHPALREAINQGRITI